MATFMGNMPGCQEAELSFNDTVFEIKCNHLPEKTDRCRERDKKKNKGEREKGNVTFIVSLWRTLSGIKAIATTNFTINIKKTQ